jgi:hypothetical protein
MSAKGTARPQTGRSRAGTHGAADAVREGATRVDHQTDSGRKKRGQTDPV